MNILETHQKNRYVVSLVNIDDNTLIVEFPENIFFNTPPVCAVFTITPDGFTVESEYLSEEVECKDYEVRPLIQQTIAINCGIRYIPLILIDNIKNIFALKEPHSLEAESEYVNNLADELESLDQDVILTRGIIL